MSQLLVKGQDRSRYRRGVDQPPTPPARRADSRRSRQAILAAAERLLRDGRPRFTMIDLARDAAVTRATLYRHFADREEVLDALAAAIADEVLPVLFEALAPLPLDEALTRLAHEVVDVGAAHAHVIGGHHRRLGELAGFVVSDEPFTDFLAERRRRGELTSPLDDRWLARCIRALCLLALDGQGGTGAVDAAALSSTLRALVCSGLK